MSVAIRELGDCSPAGVHGVRSKLALVTNFVPHYRVGLLQELARRHELRVLVTSRGGEWYWEGPRSMAAAGIETRCLKSPRRLWRELVSGGFDAAVFSLTGRATLVAALGAARSARLPWVLWVGIWEHPHTLFHTLSRPLTRSLYRAADAVVTYGPHVSDYVAAESGRTSRVFVARQAVGNERFRVSVANDTIHRVCTRLGLRDGPTATYVGRLREEKGLSFLLDASARIGLPHELVIAGDGPQLADLRVRAEALGIASRVRFVGKIAQADLPALLAASSFLVLPSISTPRWREPWGLVVNEAMNAGLPVVATDAVGAAAGGLVVRGQTGLIVAERDTAALAGAMNDLLRDPDECRRLGETARTHVLAWNYRAAADAFDAALDAARSGRAT